MPRLTTLAVALAVGLFIVLSNALFVVGQRSQAVVLQFGEAVSIINAKGDDAGLKIKIPFAQQHIIYDRRILDLAPNGPSEIVAANQERLEVDAFAKWRISNPLNFYRSVRTTETARIRLQGLMEASMRRVLGGASSNEIISARRAALMEAIRVQMNREAANLGIEVVDVKIRAADLPQANQERVFTRMESERQQAAATIRAEGDRRGREIRADADRERASILAGSYGQDPEFAAFYRSMLAYERAIQPGTTIVMTPQGDFFRYFDSRTGAGGN